MSLHTITSIQVNGQEIETFEDLKIHQRIDGHHEFEMRVNQESFSKQGKGQFNQVKDFLGKEIVIEISSMQAFSGFKPFRFKGLVTSVGTGKSSGNMHGECTIRGFSPTILLDDDLHVETYEQKNLQAIVQEVIKNYPGNLLKPSVGPKNSETHKYIVQYNENSYTFLSRLSGRFGEWFFYSGEELVFGEYNPAKTELTHDVDLIDFELELNLRPANARLTSYEYRNDAKVESDTRSQQVEASNAYSTHALKMSDSLYTHEALYKVNYGFNSAASRQIQSLALQQKKSRVAEMVLMKGSSKNPSVRIGGLITVKEKFFNEEDFGDYVVTQVSHHCNADGDYQNRFVAVPSDAACPHFNLSSRPSAEPQSAVVVENNDPKGLGRIRVRFQWQEQGMTPWLRVISSAGGGDKGFYMIPEIGEEVFVDFEGGNPECPFVVGTTYNGSAKSSFGNAGNDVKAIKTRSGNSIIMNDNSKSMVMQDPSGGCVKLNGDGTLNISAPEKVVIDAAAIEITGGKTILVQTSGEDITITGQKNVKIKATAEGVSIDSTKDTAVTALKNFKVTATEDVTVGGKKGGFTLSDELTVDGGGKATFSSGETNIM